ncbi:hypothetical protein AMATHDRAFT_71189 [Amanita thiersii Skay4041]|uniref:Histone chaperone domain-containing protein n=1 Tax=Amanita thiersii Skay4041 TaxID=703135 RepID=A0A2A9N720_9AGAR|nr:hypothetical protein AMATHDRAFT_71189 [Amanita thiersii Skay4041]
MSTSATTPNDKQSGATEFASPKDKGKSKAPVDVPMEEEEDDEEDDEEEDEDEDEDEEEEAEETFEEIDPSAILSTGRRTRGIKVDYTSKEALEKAGLKGDEEDEDEDVSMKD